jgi:hypothetical protein
MLSKLLKLIILIICVAFINSLAEASIAASSSQGQERKSAVIQRGFTAERVLPAAFGLSEGSRRKGELLL